MIESGSLLSMSALHFFESDLDDGDEKDQRHSGELHPRKQTQLDIDWKQIGMGSINSWRPAARPIPPAFQNYSYSFRIKPF